MSISGLIWWKSEVNFSPFPDLAACRIRSSACVTLSRLCVRHVLCCSGVPSVPALRSARSASPEEDLFAGFIATMAGSDPSAPFVIGFGSSPSRYGPQRLAPSGRV